MNKHETIIQQIKDVINQSKAARAAHAAKVPEKPQEPRRAPEIPFRCLHSRKEKYS